VPLVSRLCDQETTGSGDENGVVYTGVKKKKEKCLSFVVQRPFCMLEKLVRDYTPGGLHASVEGGKGWRGGGESQTPYRVHGGSDYLP